MTWTITPAGVQHPEGHPDGGYLIPTERFRTLEDLGFWLRHLNGKGWHKDSDLSALIHSFDELNPGTMSA